MTRTATRPAPAVAVLVLLGLVLVGPVVVASPVVASPVARAATIATVTTLADPDRTVTYGDGLVLSGSVTDAAGNAVTAGTVTAYAVSTAAPTPVPVASSTTPAAFSFAGLQPSGTTRYYAVYEGGATATDSYAPSQSVTGTVRVRRRLTITSHAGFRVRIRAVVAPDYAHRPLRVFTKFRPKASWRLFRTVRTTAAGVARLRLPHAGPRLMYVRFLVPRRDGFLPTQVQGHVN